MRGAQPAPRATAPPLAAPPASDRGDSPATEAKAGRVPAIEIKTRHQDAEEE